MRFTYARKLLQECHTHADDRPSPRLLGEEISPLSPLEAETLLARMRSLFDDFLELDFGHDASPFYLNTIIIGREASEFGKRGQGVIVSANE